MAPARCDSEEGLFIPMVQIPTVAEDRHLLVAFDGGSSELCMNPEAEKKCRRMIKQWRYRRGSWAVTVWAGDGECKTFCGPLKGTDQTSYQAELWAAWKRSLRPHGGQGQTVHDHRGQ